MMLAAARYVRTATGPTSGSYGTTRTQGYFDAARKVSPLVTKLDSGTPSVSAFRLEEAGWWQIETGGLFTANCNIAICRGGFATANELASNGTAGTATPVAPVSLCVLREFSVLEQVMIAWTLATAAATMTLRDDNNHVSFTYLGAV